MRIDPGDRDAHAAILKIFYGDVDEAAATAAISLLGADGPLGMAAEAFVVRADRYGAVPHTYVVWTRDNVIPASCNVASHARSTLSRTRRAPSANSSARIRCSWHSRRRLRHRHRGLCRCVRYVILWRAGVGEGRAWEQVAAVGRSSVALWTPAPSTLTGLWGGTSRMRPEVEVERFHVHVPCPEIGWS
ncbi:hypothetical protein [Streptomyces sp. WAC 06725]|uniref:hypothetical protein n=1 Tax=Streptomyces sp. WAC 06725 TaxID=2203209 RepID=UPI001C8BDCA2|nr:hypothetical protein [Streptomyces sp. WAC 06725]